MNDPRENRTPVSWSNRLILVDLPLQLGFAGLLAAAGSGGWLLASYLVPASSAGFTVAEGAVSLGVALAVVGLLFAHRIAGPLYAMVRQLAELAEGRLPARRGARHGDFLRPHLLLVQDVLSRLRAQEREELARLDEVIEALTGPSPKSAREVAALLEPIRLAKASFLGREPGAARGDREVA